MVRKWLNTVSIKTPSPRLWQASTRRANPSGPPVGFVDGHPEDPVIAPAVRPVERVDRHEFDEVDADAGRIGKAIAS